MKGWENHLERGRRGRVNGRALRKPLPGVSDENECQGGTPGTAVHVQREARDVRAYVSAGDCLRRVTGR